MMNEVQAEINRQQAFVGGWLVFSNKKRSLGMRFFFLGAAGQICLHFLSAQRRKKIEDRLGQALAGGARPRRI